MKKRGQRLNKWSLIKKITNGLFTKIKKSGYIGSDVCTEKFVNGPLNRLILVMIIRCVERQIKTQKLGILK
jgi:hypothetical protein